MKQLLATLTIFALCTAASKAQLVVGWNTAGNDSTTPPTADEFAVEFANNVAIGDWTLSSVSPPEVRAVTDLYATRGYTNVTSLDTSRLYTGFTLSADPGFELALTGISFSSSISGASSGAPTKGAWGYRVDDGSGFSGWTTFIFDLSSTLVVSSGNMQSWDFSSTVTTSGVVEFGFWAWGGTTNRNVAVISVIDGGLGNGFSVNGSVNPVPEPSTGILLGVGALAVVFFTHRKLRSKGLCIA